MTRQSMKKRNALHSYGLGRCTASWMRGSSPRMTNSEFVHVEKRQQRRARTVARTVTRNSRRNGLRAHLLFHLRDPSLHRLAGRVLLDHRLGLGADRFGGFGEIERL